MAAKDNFLNFISMATIFTKIVNGEIPSYKIAEDDRHYAFLDINPVVKGHTLVIPKREVDYVFDLSEEEIADLMKFARKVAISIKSNIDCERVAVMVLGLEVPHAHVHLMPINSESEVNLRNKLTLSPDEFKEIQEKIKI